LTSTTGYQPKVQKRDLADSRRLLLDTSQLTPGVYRLALSISDSAGNACARRSQTINFIAGPTYPMPDVPGDERAE